MVRKLAFATCVISALAVAAPAQAQLCTGQPSFSSGPVQVSPGAAFTEGATEFGGSVVGGSDRFFGGAGLFRTNYSDIDEGAFAVARVDHALGLEVEVGPLDGNDADAQISRKCSD